MKRKAKTAFTSVLSLLLAVVMVVAAAPLSGFVGLELPVWMTAEAATSGIYTYEIADGEATITDCDTSASGAITIPSTLGGYPVTSIGYGAFEYCNKIKSITIPDSVTYISWSAFYYKCDSLTDITVDNSNQYYSSADGVLFNKDKTELVKYPAGNTRTNYTIPDSVTSINIVAFWNCDSLTSVTIPNSVTSIGYGAFEYCDGLTSMTIPDSVTSIGYDAFAYCDNLTNITVDNSNQYYSSADDVLFNKDKTELVRYPIGNARTRYSIPNSVTSIGVGAFEDCDNLTNVTIPDSVTSIGNMAFGDCSSLTDMTIPDSVMSIGDGAFELCDSLTSVTIPDSVTSIGDGAFELCTSLTSVTIPNSVTSIGNWTFSSCDSLTNVTIGSSVTSIGDSAFYDCNGLSDVYYNGTADEWEAITIGSNNDPLLNATIHYNSVSSNIFSYTIADGEATITDCDESVSGAVTIPSTIEGYPVTSIGNSAFSICYSLTNVTIPDSVTNIGDGAFFGCTSLTSVTIPNSVTSIGNGAFWACYNLTNITVDISNQYYSGADGVLFNKDKTVLIQYPIGNKRTSYIIPNSVTSIGDGAFWACSNLSDVYYNGTADEWEAIVIEDNNAPLLNATIHYNQNVTDNIYNLGEETYSFENFSDSDSEGGHCFGMAVTSSGYYIGSLNKSIIGSNDNSALYSFGDSSTVRKPICHYQKIQGPGAEQKSIVAGGSKDLYGKENIESDWNACVNYVKNHEYDNKGSLNIGMWFADGGGGHAVNFLYYKEVNGQQRIYAYDNNFPETETYYYMGSDGYVHQAPKQTSSRDIVGIDLMDAEKYFTLAEEFDFKRYIYADKNEITVEGATMYYMKCSPELGSYVMYEIPAGVDEVTVVPLVDNAEFEYFGEEYAFGEINDETSGILKLATDDEGSASQEPSLTILNAPDEEPSIFAKIFGTIGKILLAPVNLIVSLFKAIIELFK